MADLPIRVAVHGALGKMGREVLAALCQGHDTQAVGGVDAAARENALQLPDGSRRVPLAADVPGLLVEVRPQVIVDFTNAEAGLQAARVCAQHGVNFVSGSTGWTDEGLEEMKRLADDGNIGALVAPNFALGAVLLIHLASIAGRFFEYAEVLEAHHEEKIDAPSGTALAIARAAAQGRGGSFTRPMPTKEPAPGARGAEVSGVSIHSSRMPGRLAHHELVLGAAGQTLSIRHDTINRECFMPGVLMGIHHVMFKKGLVVGLERVMGLEQAMGL